MVRAIFREINKDGTAWHLRMKEEGICRRPHIRLNTCERENKSTTRMRDHEEREQGNEKARNIERERERERRSRSLKAKWPGCAPCITISLGKS